jgi:hypothetical protein
MSADAAPDVEMDPGKEKDVAGSPTPQPGAVEFENSDEGLLGKEHL